MDNFIIKKFDMKKMKNDSTVVLIGKRRTGKSFLIKDMLYHKQNIPSGLVISNTDHVSDPPFFQQFIPRILIHKEYSSKILQDVFKRQEKAKQENWKNKYFFVVMDDCISDANAWKKDKSIKEIFFNGRHYKILYILSTQDPMAITPGLRGNIDYIFIHKTNNKKVMNQIFDNYAGIFDSFTTFKYFLEKCTQDNRVMVIDNATTSTNIEDVVFFYKADPHDDFKMFSQETWDRSDEIYSMESSREQRGNTIVINKK